ncbi:MAG: threonine ammonia-lyase [bacterium]|jgi:threonine dehydratase
MTVTLPDIIAARRRLWGIVRETPLEPNEEFADYPGPVYLKLENYQKTGSFKIRGAVNRIATLTEQEKAAGVITASSGNHAQGVGYAARRFGVKAKIFVPENTPATKIAATRRYGAKVIVAGRDYDAAAALAYTAAGASGMTFVHAYGDSRVIAGQGTVGLEMLLEKPDLAAIVVPVGGGGLIAGTAVAAKTINPAIQIYGVQPAASPPWYYALRGEDSGAMEYGDTLADGLAGGIDGAPFELVRQFVDDIVLVEEAAIVAAIRWFAKKHHMMVEGAGAVGVAALQSGRLRPDGPVGVIVSGGNIDPGWFAAVLGQGKSGLFLPRKSSLEQEPAGSGGETHHSAAVPAPE